MGPLCCNQNLPRGHRACVCVGGGGGGPTATRSRNKDALCAAHSRASRYLPPQLSYRSSVLMARGVGWAGGRGNCAKRLKLSRKTRNPTPREWSEVDAPGRPAVCPPGPVQREAPGPGKEGARPPRPSTRPLSQMPRDATQGPEGGGLARGLCLVWVLLGPRGTPRRPSGGPRPPRPALGTACVRACLRPWRFLFSGHKAV